MIQNELINSFQKIKTEDDLKNLIVEKTKEDLHLEFKTKHDSKTGVLDDSDKKNFSKSLSGFANSDGGILIWGVLTNKKDESAKKLVAICKVDDFIRSLKSSLQNSVQPFVDDVLIEKITCKRFKSKGYVKCLIPRSEKTPHRAMLSNREYYKRSVEGFYRLEHFDLEDMFGRRQRPVLKMSVETKKHPGDDSKLKDLSFYFLNEGRAVAKYHGFWCRFDDNIEIKGVDINLKNISKFNDGKPTISFENSVGVIHPNGIQVHIGTLTYTKKNNRKKVVASIRFYCDGMATVSTTFKI